jgi:hypothetical protein
MNIGDNAIHEFVVSARPQVQALLAKLPCMSRSRKTVAGIVLVALVAGLAFYSLSDIGHQALQLHLELYGSSIYEYHARTGQWPSSADDLARTSLPEKSPHWKTMLDNGTIVIVWPRNLQSDPRNNPGVILAYHNRGLLASMGRVWVCWGDLRTEYIGSADLQSHLRNQQE